jgi:hypothetical protein
MKANGEKCAGNGCVKGVLTAKSAEIAQKKAGF